jgi:hypothetical protein
MTLAEARSVFWLRNKHRPMGELFDEGYLDEYRLSWAAENAYNSRLKEAAGVLLEHLHHTASAAPPAADGSVPEGPEEGATRTINVGISLEEARRTPWPFRSFKGRPMGELVSTQQLSLKDLGFAVENAWDKRVQRAAAALLAERLNQVVQEPSPSAGPLAVISGGPSYSEEQRLNWTLIEGMLLGAVLVLWLLLVFYAVRSSILNPPQLKAEHFDAPWKIVVLVVLFGITVLIIWGLSKLLDTAFQKTETQIERARRGQEGEEQVLESLRRNLDGSWTLFRNVVLPGKNKGDIDAVLVGPVGVWALEIKNYRGAYRNFGEQWEMANGGHPKPLKKSPSRQADANAKRLANFLRADGIRQWIEPAVVWANRESALVVEQPAVPVWPLARLPEELGNLWQGQPLEEEHRSRIEKKLAALCKQQRAQKEKEARLWG